MFASSARVGRISLSTFFSAVLARYEDDLPVHERGPEPTLWHGLPGVAGAAAANHTVKSSLRASVLLTEPAPCRPAM